ncbi:MAG: hypothetical protein FWG72_04710 [Oscillospiraceae bacterium]|nr:hypothetical protein [Oscillospiraceae bacterium]
MDGVLDGVLEWDGGSVETLPTPKPSPSPAPTPETPVWGPDIQGIPDVPDMSSPETFIQDIKRMYSITLTDEHKHLSGPDGGWMMKEISRCLALYSPGFVREMTAMYAEYGSRFFIRLDSPSEDDYGAIEWEDDVIIYLRYDSVPEWNGITAATLSHEMAHAVHFIVEEMVGEEEIKREMRMANKDFAYVGNRYDSVWQERIHAAAFAYDYGMYDAYEDAATILEMLVDDPEGMRRRLNNPENAILRRKTEYLYALASMISDECGALFAPLFAEAYPAAA